MACSTIERKEKMGKLSYSVKEETVEEITRLAKLLYRTLQTEESKKMLINIKPYKGFSECLITLRRQYPKILLKIVPKPIDAK